MKSRAHRAPFVPRWLSMFAVASLLGAGACSAVPDAQTELDDAADEENIETANQLGSNGERDLSKFVDPGKSAWQTVPQSQVASVCKLDPSKLPRTLGAGYAVVRYGKLCYISDPLDGPSQMFSSTKTLGAAVTGIASYLTRDIARGAARTGQLRDDDLATYWLGSVSYNRQARLAHVLAMVGHNSNLTDGAKRHAYDTIGAVQINSLSDAVRTAITQRGAQIGALSTGALARTYLFDELGMSRSSWGGTMYATSWTATLGDMARFGLLLIHQGVWSGKQVMGEDWAYKMVHPTFEDGNTAYGFLTWLVAREGQRSIGGGSFTGNGGSAGGLLADKCSPAALWQRYPHGLSTFRDCTYKSNSCQQQHDVGAWSAQGLGGQFIVGHPGLDLVIVAKNYSDSGKGPAGLWDAVRPALVALDPQYRGNESAFCDAYAKGDYAPDLANPPRQPN
ncbi:MAG: hypothetical protein ABW252_02785 [Polyangiales bacterium]